jgi:DNA adenine methylase
MKFYSPFRYPGGKSRLVPFIKTLITKTGLEKATYIEPFAGGAGVALGLLLEGIVERIVINDYDKAIYSFWRAIKTEPSSLIKLIDKTSVTIEEWRKQRNIYQNSQSYSLDLAFATLFLNRVNRSGIITGGPIGGYEQNSKWKLDARFNKNTLIDRITQISNISKSITIYNKDIICLLDKIKLNYTDNVFIYFDPPYYYKSQRLYKNCLSHRDHERIADRILRHIKSPMDFNL